jgi:hypothetical protein
MTSQASSAAADGAALPTVLDDGEVGRRSLAGLVFPSGALRPRWSSASVLMYAGVFVLLSATMSLIGALAARHGDGALFGLTALVVGALVVVALLARYTARDLVAGLVAFVAVIAFTLWIGVFLQWIGVLPETWEPFEGFEPSFLVLELTTVVVALAALAAFRSPLLVLPAAAALWYGVVDLVGGDRAGQRVAASIAAGLLLVVAGAVADRRSRRPIAFWLHTTGALAVGGAVVWQWSSSHADWAIVALVAFLFLATARVLGRSTYAVLAVAGLYGSGSHFIASWFDGGGTMPYPLGLYFGEGESSAVAGPLLYGLLAASLIALGVVLEATGVRTTKDEGAEVDSGE